MYMESTNQHFTPGEVEMIVRDPNSGVWLNERSGSPTYMPSGPNSDVMLRGSGGSVIRYSDVSRVLNRGLEGKVAKFANVYPGPTDVHVNTALSNMAVAYELGSDLFVAPKLCPIFQATHRSDVYFRIERGDVARDYQQQSNRGIGGVANDIEQGFSQQTFTVVDRALRTFLPDKVVSNADEALQLVQQATTFVQEVMTFIWDRRVLTLLGTISATATFASLTTGGAGTVATSTTSAPYINQAIQSAVSAVQLANNGRPPNTMVVSSNLARQIANSPQVIQQTIYDNGGARVLGDGGISNQTSALCGLPPRFAGMDVVVVNLPTNTAAKGATASFSVLFPQQIGLLYVEQPSRRTRNCATTFRVGPLSVRTYRDEQRRGMYVEVEMDQIEALTNSYAGYLITAAGT